MAFFGFEHVEDHIKTDKIKDLFSRVTNSYDLMNDVMSAGTHRLWKRYFIRKLRLHPKDRILDMASGTGDIAQGILEKYPFLDLSITAVDLTESMLRLGKDKAINKGILKGIDYIVADGEKLPLPDESADVYLCVFGLRNVGNLENACKEAYRILKKGGRFYCLEFSEVTTPALKSVYDLYSYSFIPKMGKFFAKDEKAYAYLVDSIRSFPNQTRFQSLLESVGFEDVSYENLNFGITAIHQGFKN